MDNKRLKYLHFLLAFFFIVRLQGQQLSKQGEACLLEEAMAKAGLVDLQTWVPGLITDLRYSGSNNFLGRDIYGCLSKAYATQETALKLRKAMQSLTKAMPGYRFLVFDAARPLRCQWDLWNALSMPAKARRIYVADPRRGSIHNYGCALDLTICDAGGKPLDMGTDFDFFGEAAQPRCEERLRAKGRISSSQLKNRILLRTCMRSAGFLGTSSEWWHFNSCSLRKAKTKFKAIP